MARLAELTYQFSTGTLEYSISLLTSDVRFKTPDLSTRVVLLLRDAKTCKPGEVQRIRLNPLNNMLCPVEAIKTLSKIWAEGDFGPLSGHSFRVGGASLRNALGVDIQEICRLGRWVSECYKLYLRQYTPREKAEAVRLMNELDCCWSNSTS
ncbi:hypothetical protein PSTG_01270 [Puccinia striiformis f. sp. tritici PST-78]|uniref:Tyr recombinase domain-containing protein n=1 Tax=Puccinia striiformis f. sp. tritici PST-78 TaxID=1165861 RepID=A0A0L0W2J7_9BASI|nr:hypothetical protein PSTG_01270 [Puccinia striiformis f. sp. tritici PST-78]